MSLEATPTTLSTNAIREYAERVAEHYELFREGYSADLDGLVERLGGSVDVSESMFAIESLTVEGVGKFVIHLPPVTSHRRDRFTIAHELGHYFLHYLFASTEEPRRFGRGSRNKAETQANYFAASLLMPEAQFRKAYQEFDGKEWAIADAFGVSPQAAAVRAKTLGLEVK